MSSRRAPLLNNPNAVNSPYRPSAAPSKQKRSYANIQREDAYGQPPPAKKQMVERGQVLRTPPRNQTTHVQAEGRVFTRRPTSQPSAFEKKCVIAARENRAQQAVVKDDKISEDNLETVRQWQKHYRKAFPFFVFYFESVPEEIHHKLSKQVAALNSTEEKFFSNAVTHVVTTRNIPIDVKTVEEPSSTTNESNSQNSQPQTINPSLLDRSSESVNAQSESHATKGKFSFDNHMSRRLGPQIQDAEVRRQQARNADVLHRARDLNIKIWALDKLQRMMTTMFDTDTGYQVVHGHNTRSNSVQASIPRATTNLSQLLRNEKLNGPSDRDLTVASKELTLFKGCFIYVHDIDEKQRPIMVRDYPKVSHKEEGEWPQFRSVTGGKCPFVEERDYSQREEQKEKEMRLQRQKEKEKAMAPRTRAAAAVEESKMQPPRSLSKNALAETTQRPNRNVTVATRQANPFAPSKSSLAYRNDIEPSSHRGNAFVSRAGAGRLLAGEPVASGLQASNVTSAIRSQMISSTSAQPGAKAGTSKEVHGLQRKVLEKNSGGPGSYGLTSSHRMNDLSAAAREESFSRQSRRKEKLEQLAEEDANQSEQEGFARTAALARKSKTVQQKKSEKRDLKPGYCENCQDKFEDFDEHVISRKHRKFAEKAENWQELDALLSKLARPLKKQVEEEYDDY